MTHDVVIFLGAWIGLLHTPSVVGALIKTATLGGMPDRELTRWSLLSWAFGWSMFLAQVLS